MTRTYVDAGVLIAAVAQWPADLGLVAANGFEEACRTGMSAMDALHLAAAISLNADEFITTEKPDKPIHRTSRVRVVSIRP